MSKLNRKEFKELLLEWKQSFVNEKVNPLTKSTLNKFTSLKGKKSELIEFPITLINFKIDNEDEYEDIIAVIYDMKKEKYDFVNNVFNSATTIVLHNNESNKNKLINSELFKEFLSQEDLSRFRNARYNENIIIQAEIGDFERIGHITSNDEETNIYKKIFTLHDVYHSTLDSIENTSLIQQYLLNNSQIKSLENKHREFENSIDNNEKNIDYNIFQRYIFDKLSNKKLHAVNSDDLPASLFAFLFLFIMEYDKTKNKINVEKSINNLDKIKNEISNFEYIPYVNKNYNYEYSNNQTKIKNIDLIINYLKSFLVELCKMFQEIYLDNKEKYIIISVIA